MAEYQECLENVMEHLHDRARTALEDIAVDEVIALRYSQEFCTVAELIRDFGTALIAFEDIEGFDVTEAEIVDDDPVDDGESHGVN